MGARPEGVRSLICRAGSPEGLVTGEVVVDMVRCFFVEGGMGAAVEVGERRCLVSVEETSVRTGVVGRSSAVLVVVDIVCCGWELVPEEVGFAFNAPAWR